MDLHPVELLYCQKGCDNYLNQLAGWDAQAQLWVVFYICGKGLYYNALSGSFKDMLKTLVEESMGEELCNFK